MSRLIYIDSFCYGHFHEDFNASSLLMFSKLYRSVRYYSTHSSKTAVEAIIGEMPENVSWHLVPEIRDGGSLRNAVRHAFSSIVNVLILFCAPKDSVVYINFNSIWGLKALARVSKFRRIGVIQQCHGELEYLDENGLRRLNRISTWGLSLIRKGFFADFSHFHFAVLGESIMRNVSKLVDHGTMETFFSFEHPFVTDRDNNTGTIADIVKDTRIKLAIVGAADVSKGLSDFLALSRKLDKSCFRLFSVGRVDRVASILDEYGIEYIPGAEHGFVPREKMMEYINSMDAILFFYPFDSYRLTASGALLNVIELEKPIFSFANSYFESIFAENGIGRLFYSADEMCEFIYALDRFALEEYRYQGVIDRFSPDCAKERLLPELKRRELL